MDDVKISKNSWHYKFTKTLHPIPHNASFCEYWSCFLKTLAAYICFLFMGFFLSFVFVSANYVLYVHAMYLFNIVWGSVVLALLYKKLESYHPTFERMGESKKKDVDKWYYIFKQKYVSFKEKVCPKIEFID